MADQFSAIEMLLGDSSELDDPVKRKATAAALRRQNAMGVIGQLMGVQPTQMAGTSMIDNSQQSLKLAMAQRQAARESETAKARQAVEDQRYQQNYDQRERGIDATRTNQAATLSLRQQAADRADAAAAAAADAKQSAADIKRDDAARKSRADQDVVLGALRSANEGLEDLKVLLAHPGREAATGGSYLAGSIPGTSAKDYRLLARKLANSAFMQARESLKGAGAVTDFEGAKAQEAITILGDTSASEEQHLQALYDFQDVLNSVARKNGLRAQELGIPPELLETTKPKRKPAPGTAPAAGAAPAPTGTAATPAYVFTEGDLLP